jgi:hypothetical protein
MKESPQILVKVYDYLLYLIPQAAKFPRNQRYLLGERLETLSLEILEILIAANFSKERLPLLRQANIKLEQARYHVRLCKDLKLFNAHRYEVISKMIDDIGIQLGGWIKQQAARV